mgnify:CR=1 FL=1
MTGGLAPPPTEVLEMPELQALRGIEIKDILETYINTPSGIPLSVPLNPAERLPDCSKDPLKELEKV